ncbi:Auxiliary transport protein, membrane fusion protein (MFP) family protein [Enhydrobacter sp. AX1]|nr:MULTISPECIES: HlyD family efflux transporter periplasmic adaptor subunit [Pseudomonadota]VXB68412.1 Auxiliary transport protein, membrane fusion protein (MFP) family protein [Enhydrobacter sp. AX1]
MKKSYYILIALILAVAVAFAVYMNYKRTADTTPEGFASSNGRLQLQNIDVASLRAGRVSQVLVHEGDLVEKGTPLVTLSSEELDTQLQGAEAAKLQAEAAKLQAEGRKSQAQAAKARAEGAVTRAMGTEKRAEGGYARTQGGVNQADAVIAAKKAQLQIALDNLNNTKALRKDDLVSIAELQQREQAYQAAKAEVLAAQAAKAQAAAGGTEAQAGIAEAQSGIAEAKAAVAEAQAGINQAQAGIEQAQAGINQAQSQINRVKSIQSDMYVRAPQAGRVEYRIVEVGNVIAPGSKVVTLVDPNDVYLEIFLPTDSSNQVQIGSPARIVLDGIKAVLPAKVSFVANQSQFTPKSVETKNEREKMMYRVKLSLDPQVASRYQTLLKGGMTAQGYVQLDPSKAWSKDLEVKMPSIVPIAPSRPVHPQIASTVTVGQ